MAADLLHRPPKIWKFSDKKRKTKSILSECSFMPFNLQILPPGPLIPVEHVWKLKKSLSLASSCLKNYHQEGWTIEWEPEGGVRHGERIGRVKNPKKQRCWGLRTRGGKQRSLAKGMMLERGTQDEIFLVYNRPAPTHLSNNCYSFSQIKKNRRDL